MKNNITHFLEIKEPGLKVFVKNNGDLSGIFTNKKATCPSCKSNDVIKNGFKYTTPIIPSINKKVVKLHLKKQSYICKHCGYAFTPSPKFIQPRHRFSNATTLNIIEELRTTHSMTDIAKSNKVSVSTVNRMLNQAVDSHFRTTKKLPEHIFIDEFQSTKSFAFIFTDSETHKIINVFESRKGAFLEKVFSLYSKEERANVKTVSMDIFKPYFSFVKKTFPNAIIILDRFHVYQNITRAVNKSRINIMKSFTTNSHNYRMFKRFWKVFIKDTYKLSNNRKTYIVKLQKRLSTYEIAQYLCSLDNTLANIHHFLQRFYHAMNSKNVDFLKLVLNEGLENDLVRKFLETQIITTLDNIEFVGNSFIHPYNNGHLEGIINKIKTIKKNAYGFRSFENYRRRILLVFNIAV